MKTLKGLPQNERQRRNRFILNAFEQSGAENLPWMARTSPNEEEPVLEISKAIGEPVGVYTWRGPGDWFSVSVNQVTQSRGGRIDFYEFGKSQIENVEAGLDRIDINGTQFMVPPELSKIYADLIRSLEAFVVSGVSVE